VQLAEDPFDPRLSAPLADRPGIRKSRVGVGGAFCSLWIAKPR
jgi:hypothetical protein